jgi:hypothetical protein
MCCELNLSAKSHIENVGQNDDVLFWLRKSFKDGEFITAVAKAIAD